MSALIIAAVINLGTVMPAYGEGACKQLEELDRQYAGVVLTPAQKAIKRKLVWWYRRNCVTGR